MAPCKTFTSYLTGDGQDLSFSSDRFKKHASHMLFVAPPSVPERMSLPRSWVTRRHEDAFDQISSEAHSSFFHVKLDTNRRAFQDRETVSQLSIGKNISSLLLVEVEDYSAVLENFRHSPSDAIVVLFSFESLESFDFARHMVLTLSRYDILRRPILALIGTRANSPRSTVTTFEVDEITGLFPMYYCEIDEEEESFHILNAVASHLNIKPDVQDQWNSKGKASKRDFLSSIRAIPRKLMSVGARLEK